jgi:hypothetical protein
MGVDAAGQYILDVRGVTCTGTLLLSAILRVLAIPRAIGTRFTAVTALDHLAAT